MRGLRWIPQERPEPQPEQRPWLEAPSPWSYQPREAPRAESCEDDESPRVIVIEM
jgi:hypothetical protein